MKQIQDVLEKKYGTRKEKILQIGEGNFLRCFADWMIELANETTDYEGSVVLCQPIPSGLTELINAQNGMYTTVLRGLENGEPVEIFRTITSVSRCIDPYKDYNALIEVATSEDLEVIISNTTDAGIAYVATDCLDDAPPSSYPAKLCAMLYRRYQKFNGAADKGLLILPVELIDNNGRELKKIVLQYASDWHLEDGFVDWLNHANEFTSTLVDRIVTGYPKDSIDTFQEKLGYEDNLLVTGELFNLWVIEGDKNWAHKLPVHETIANVIWTDDVTPYKKQKVRILNGSHTAVIPAAFLSGYDTVLDFFSNSVFGDLERKLIDEEIIPTLTSYYDEATIRTFADQVLTRFANPYIKHRLNDILLNNSSKFSGRCIPTITDYYENTGKAPRLFAYALAAFIRLYKLESHEGTFTGIRDDGSSYTFKEDPTILTWFADLWATHSLADIVHTVLSRKDLWSDVDLTTLGDMESLVLSDLEVMVSEGQLAAVQRILN